MDPITFKRWSKRKYAVLNSFHKVIRIGTLSLAYNMLQVQPALCQNDSVIAPGLYLELEEVEALSEKGAELFPGSLRQLLIVPEEQIEQYSSRSLNEILDHLPGVDIRTRGYHGVQADLSILGGSFDQSMVLINGIDFSDPQTGHFNLDLPFLPSFTRKIELLKGPASKKYGIRAYTGAVNFVTTPEDSLKINAIASLGQFRTEQLSATGSLPIGKVWTGFTIYRSSSDGYRENTDYRHDGLFIHSVLDEKSIRSELMLGFNTRDFGANSFYTPKYPEQYEETGTFLTAFKLSVNNRHYASISWRQHEDHFTLFRTNPSFYENFHQTRVLASTFGSNFSSILGVTSARILLRYEQIYSTSLGIKSDESRRISSYPGRSYDYFSGRKHLSLGIDHTASIHQVTVNIGLLVDAGVTHLSDPGLYPGADISWKVNRELTLFSSVNRSMRLPTFTDLYYHGPQNLGNPDLLPEKAWTIQEGLNYKKGAFESSLQGFYRKGSQMIDWIRKDSIWQTENLTELDTYGAELSIAYSPEQKNTGSMIKYFAVSYGYSYISKADPYLISNYALDYLRHKVSLNTQIKPMKQLTLGFRYSLQDRNGTFSYYASPGSQPLEQEYSLFHLVDVNLAYKIQRITCFMDISNLFDTEYRDIGSVLMPGRWIMAGIRIDAI